MTRRPVGYEAFCGELVGHGVTSGVVIKHRFCLQAIAAQSRSLPVEIDHDQLRLKFTLESASGSGKRRIECEFSSLSGRSTAVLAHLPPDATGWARSAPQRLSLITAPAAMLWLFPIEDDFTAWERFQVWVEGLWIKGKNMLSFTR